MKDCDFILFGASGDLALRKIFPALFQIYSNKLLNSRLKIIASARSKFSQIEFKELLSSKLKTQIKRLNEKKLNSFLEKIHYLSIDLNNFEDFKSLKEMSSKDARTVIYFSISPEFFISTCKSLALINLNNKNVKIILEKPLGRDLNSCKIINEELKKYYKERQIYRIDHYLGKETVQNILYLRKYNPIISKLFNNKHLSFVEITVFETLGAENRGEFYDKMGALRDMFQNHMIQLLCLLTLKIPKKLSPSSLRRAKIRLLKELKGFSKEELQNNLIRAQYKGYLNEKNIKAQSKTESFLALKAFIDNKSYKKIPFYLRTGKKMQKSFVQIVLSFKEESLVNKLIISLQPQSKLSLALNVKEKGRANFKEEHLSLNLNYEARNTKPYESLIMDVIRGDLSHFNHQEELELAWLWLDPIIKAEYELALYHYEAKSFGPKEAELLIRKDGNSWHNP